MRTILWFRRDLRVHDLPALEAAREGDREPVPVFCFDERLLHGRHASGPRTQFLLESLAELARALEARGSGLVIRRGVPERELSILARELGAEEVHFTSDAGPYARARDERVRRALGDAGVSAIAHPGAFVVDDLGAIRTGAGDPFSVFTPFYRSWQQRPRRELLGAPRTLAALPPGIDRGTLPSLGELGLEQEVEDPAKGGEGAGRAAARRWINGAITSYEEERETLAGASVSRLSPYLHMGCVSALELEQKLPGGDGPAAFRRQLCWRDFYAQVLLGFPRNARSEHQERYRGTITWSRSQKRFEAWCEGRTGYPVVDAAMRQLRREGWMHNRARLIVGSFLTKDLGVDWRWGERWFMRLLIDGDEASNNGNWQWIASVGVDPQPVFRRLFNPARQQQRFDAGGDYVRRYVPELAQVPDRYLAEPWTMPEDVAEAAGCVIGRDYPEPIVDHAQARRAALERYGSAG